jgi:beta-xylosidase
MPTTAQFFKPGEIWPDNHGVHINAHGGGMLFHEGVYYWFGEHKIGGDDGNRAWVGVRCYSSTDLYNWKDEGIALKVSKHPNDELAAGCVLERPKVIYNRRTKQFVMWFHLELKGRGYEAARSGVAVSSRATGPYDYLGSLRPNGAMARDMTLFVDDDGRAYHFFASESNATMHVAQLSDDYLSPSGRFGRIFAGRYMEAPVVFKHEGQYWFIGSDCTGWAPNAARSAVANSILGPWTELGNPCQGNDAETTFHSQGTYGLPVEGRPGTFIFMADRWTPKDAIDGRYIWLPVCFEDRRMILRWRDEWDLA